MNKKMLFSGKTKTITGVMAAVILCFLFLPTISYAAVIAYYDIGSLTTTRYLDVVPPTSSASNVTAENITLGPGLTNTTSTWYDGGAFC
ncbi:MAG: hypothetical protein GWO10_08850, partial [candidate division Zixibacteria bacterium]|nr:hypothetical protein [Gammaproteobacteria bacterium]NIR63861.1 hypothetical protein [candidate division Zixibacteria bacterium]NIX00026.1 hypothetical protein [Phycisphaerae bacterium]